MKKFISILLVIALVLSFATVVYAEGNEVPTPPDVEGLSTDEANELIDDYNTQVDEYNENIDKEYEESCEEVDNHNAEEDAKVEENQQKLQEQEELEIAIEEDAQKGITEPRVTDAEELPDTWEVTTTPEDAVTIQVVSSNPKPCEKKYKIINLHLYLDDAYKDVDTFYTTAFEGNKFYIDPSIKEHLVLAEWETIEAYRNDVIKVISESSAFGSNNAIIPRQLKGYTNGYWVPCFTEFTSTCNYVEDLWDKGSATEFSYKDGRNMKDVFSMYGYVFMRNGPEPEDVVVYVPDYLTYPEKKEYLQKLDRILKEEVIEDKEDTPLEDTEKDILTPVVDDEIHQPVIDSSTNNKPVKEVKVEEKTIEEIKEVSEEVIKETITTDNEDEEVVEEVKEDEKVSDKSTSTSPVKTGENSPSSLFIILVIVVAVVGIFLLVRYIRRK